MPSLSEQISFLKGFRGGLRYEEDRETVTAIIASLQRLKDMHSDGISCRTAALEPSDSTEWARQEALKKDLRTMT